MSEIERRASRSTLRVALMFMGVCGVLVFAAAPALAERGKLSAITGANGNGFGSSGAEGEGISVDDSDNLWIAAQELQAADRLSPSGTFVSESTGPWSGLYPQAVAFSNASQHVYLTDFLSGDVWGLEPSGAYANIDLTGPWSGGFRTVGIAADNSGGVTGGDLYLAGETSVYRVDGAGGEAAFSASEPYISGNQLTGFAAGESFSAPTHVAVDASGDLFVADAGRKAVYEFEPSGKFVRAITESNGGPFGSVSAVAADPTNGHILVADPANGVIDEFDSAGVYLDNIEEVSGPYGLAVDSTGKLYVTENSGSQIGVYGAYTSPTHLPVISNGAVSSLTATSVVLSAIVNLKGGGEVSECRFEFGPSEGYGQSIPCAPEGFSSTTTVSAEPSGLASGTQFHYRVHIIDPATGPAGANGPDGIFATDPRAAGPPSSGCPNEAARQGPSVALPECRAYEQVTPLDKGVAEDMFSAEGGRIFSFGSSSERGDQFLLDTPAAIGADAVANENGYVFSRTAMGWTMSSLAVPGLGVQSISARDQVFDPTDLSDVAFADVLGTVVEHQSAEGEDAMVAGAPGGPYVHGPLITPASANSEIAGATSDFGHVIIESLSHELAAGDSSQVPGSHALYDWSGGQLQLVNVNTDRSLVSTCGAMLGQGGAGDTEGGGTHAAVSSDGSKVFFTAPDPRGIEGEPGCWAPGEPPHWGVAPEVNPPQLYMRVGGAATVKISVPEPGVNDPTPYAAVYVGASADGSRVFFVSRGELTADDPGHAAELYEYNTLTSTLMRISSGDSGNAVGEVGFVAAVSSDGSTVYFEASGRLAPGAPAGGALYRYDTVTKETTYIATGTPYPVAFGSERTTNWIKRAAVGANGQGVGLDDRANWYATADGRYLVFPSSQPVRGYDSTCSGKSERCTELYRYDAADNSIVCVSCGTTPPTDNALFARAGASVGPQSLSPRPISDDGSRVIFDTASALVPSASPGQVHVYEWHEGVISLLSPAHDPHGSYFLGMSADGANVFIGTHAQLVAQDIDTAGDLYDARIDGGFTETAPPACTGSGCQGVPPAPPIFATPSSVTFEGMGNFRHGPGGNPNAKKLAKALKACKKRYRSARKRARCDARARTRYPLAHKANARKNRGGK